MRIAVIGAGNVGGTLGRCWAAAGHDVTFGVRSPADGASAVKGGDALPPNARVTAIPDAVQGAEVVLLATPWEAVPETIALLERADGGLGNVVLVDATNPLGPGMRLLTDADGRSGGEQVQRLAPTARVVKAFNTTGANNMANPVYGGAPASMFVAGDDAVAKAVATELSTALGFETFDAGPLAKARELEHLAALWIHLAYAGGLGREIAFRLVRR